MFERRAAMATLLADRPKNLFVVPGLGSCTWDAFAAGDDDRNFYLWGAMGGAAMIGLGLALAQAEAARRGHHRRRRDADGAGQPRHHRRAAAGQPRHRGVRQRPLWRDRHAGEPHQRRRRSAATWRAAAASSACSTSRTRPGLKELAGLLAHLRRHAVRARAASRRTIRRACCRRRTASSSRSACAARWRRPDRPECALRTNDLTFSDDGAQLFQEALTSHQFSLLEAVLSHLPSDQAGLRLECERVSRLSLHQKDI